MDPFIEAVGLWRDFHDRLLSELERELSNRVSEQYFVRLAARTYLVPDEELQQNHAPVGGRAASRAAKAKTPAVKSSGRVGAKADSPIQMLAPLDMEANEIFIEIHQVRPDRRLVTGIEILSPANKVPETAGWDEYVKRRRLFLGGEANFVELDLLRNGRRMPMREAWPDSPYYILVSRKEHAPRCQVWPAHSVRALPRLAVPLGRGDMDIDVDLQGLADAVYERAQFASLIDYKRAIHPPLAPPEKKLLARAPKRRPKRNKAG